MTSSGKPGSVGPLGSKCLQGKTCTTGARGNDSTERGGNSRRSCEAFGRGGRPAVPQCLCAAAPGRTGNCGILPPSSRSAAAIGGADGSDQPAFRGRAGSFRNRAGLDHRPVPKETTQRRCCGRTGAEIPQG